MAPFVSAMLPFLSAMFPFMSTMLLFMCAMLSLRLLIFRQRNLSLNCCYVIFTPPPPYPGHCDSEKHPIAVTDVHRALCCLFRPDTDGTCVSKCGQLSQQTRRLDPMLFQCWSSAVGGGPILKQDWVKCSRLLGSTQVSVYTHPSATIIFSPADQGTFSKTAGQSQSYYNT